MQVFSRLNGIWFFIANPQCVKYGEIAAINFLLGNGVLLAFYPYIGCFIIRLRFWGMIGKSEVLAVN